MRILGRWLSVGLNVLSVSIGVFITQRAFAQDLSNTKTLYTVANSHLDSDWVWTVQTTINTYLRPTLLENFALIEKYPHYVFNFEGAIRYMWMKEYYPADYATLKKYVAQGRWNISGMSIDAADVNITSPESLIRHALYANRFYQKEFGKSGGLDIFLPDCFGFGYALPTIATHCGLLGFSTNKLSWGGVIIPYDIGTWTGPDDSRIVAALRPDTYDSTFSGLFDSMTSHDSLAQIDALGKTSGVFAAYRYYGRSWDRGGGPPEQSVIALGEAMATSPSGVRVLSASTDQLYRDLTVEQKNVLPNHRGELLMTTHGTGCYTSHAEVKWGNQQNEAYADAAESASVIASWLGAITYPHDKLTEAWVRFLWHHHHDDITGTSLPDVYRTTFNDQMLSRNQFASTLTHAVGAITQALDTQTKGIPIVVYNPLAIPREDVVEAEIAYPQDSPKAFRVFDPENNEVPSQLLMSGKGRLKIAFIARLDSLGLGVYDVRAYANSSTLKKELTVNSNGLENARYRVTVNGTGAVSSVYDKSESRELLRAPLELQMLTNTTSVWPAWEISWNTASSAPRPRPNGVPIVKIVEDGSVRVGLEITSALEDSKVVQTLRLSSGGAADRLEIETLIDWQSKNTLLKASFPLEVANPEAVFDIGMGTVTRGNANRSLYEVPALHWADLTNQDRGYGVSILSKSKYGWDKPTDNTLRLSLIHTPDASVSDYGWQSNNDIGRHRIDYAIYGHVGRWNQASTVSQAARMERPLFAFQTSRHAGVMGSRWGFASVDRPAVVIRALKRAEDTSEIIIRLQETAGEAQSNVRIVFATPVIAAREVNGIEVGGGVATLEHGQLVVNFTKYQPRTFAITLENPGAVFSLPVSSPVELPFDSDVVSAEDDKSDGAMDSFGHSFPAELFPSTVTAGEATFSLGSSLHGKLNGLRCQGQRITLPSGNFNRLHLLMAADTNAVTLPFDIGQKNYEINVSGWQRLIGDLGPIPGGNEHSEGINRTEVAWTSTHLHAVDSSPSAETYAFGHLYRYTFDLLPGTTHFVLPNTAESRHVVLFAVSVTRTNGEDIRPVVSEYPVLPSYDRIPTVTGPEAITPSEKAGRTTSHATNNETTNVGGTHSTSTHEDEGGSKTVDDSTEGNDVQVEGGNDSGCACVTSRSNGPMRYGSAIGLIFLFLFRTRQKRSILGNTVKKKPR
jgi:alpha-mannosidase